MQRFAVWVGTGLLTTGVTAAMLAGAGIAAAEDTASPPASGANTSAPAKPDTDKPATDTSDKPDAAQPDKPEAEQPDNPGADEPDVDKPDEDTPDTDEPDTDEPAVDQPVADEPEVIKPDKPAVGTPDKLDTVKLDKPETPAADEPEATEVAEPEAPVDAQPAAPAPAEPVVHSAAARKAVVADAGDTAEVAVTAALVTPGPVIVKPTPAGLPSILAFVGNVVFGLLSSVEQLVNGLAPALPAHSTVTMRTGRLEVAPGYYVAANWYYPKGDTPPEQMILLSHGFLAIGPMYSHTAANLAEQTNSIVVTTTLLSNFLAGDGMWLGGDAMHRSIANLFIGERSALTASANSAGFADRYNLDPATAVLPTEFALAGHSLGGALVSGVAGYLAENGGAANLAGVILLDGVPIGSQLPDALERLNQFHADGGRFVPVREIGAPWNLWNSLSNVNESLDAGRADHYKGVILDGGVHMDSMQGGNPVIQFAAFLAAGFPQPQNPPAVQQLMATWLGQWFSGHPYEDDDLVGGSPIVIELPNGDVATGIVIGTPVAKLEEVAA